jgi:hypothetical protein
VAVAVGVLLAVGVAVAVTVVRAVAVAVVMVVSVASIRSAKQDDNYGASNIILPCPGS